MPNTDWLPQNHEALHDKAQQTNNYLTEPMNRDRLGFGPMTPYGQWFDTDFSPKFSAFSTAFSDWLNPAERTHLKTDALAAVEKVFVPSYRQLYTGMLKGNPLVTDVNLDAMGLPKHHRPKGALERNTERNNTMTENGERENGERVMTRRHCEDCELAKQDEAIS